MYANVGTPELKAKGLLVAIKGVIAGAGCHCGMINNVGMDDACLPRWGWTPGTPWHALLNIGPGGRGGPTANTTTDQKFMDEAGTWLLEQTGKWTGSSNYDHLPRAFKEQIFEGLLAYCTMSMYLVAPVINYVTPSRTANKTQRGCMTSEFIEWIIQNRKGYFVAGPTQVNRNYSGRDNISLVRGGIWIPDPKLIVKYDDETFSGTLPAAEWHKVDPKILTGVTDWNKLGN